jgi:hypothetical protein
VAAAASTGVEAALSQGRAGADRPRRSPLHATGRQAGGRGARASCPFGNRTVGAGDRRSRPRRAPRAGDRRRSPRPTPLHPRRAGREAEQPDEAKSLGSWRSGDRDLPPAPRCQRSQSPSARNRGKAPSAPVRSGRASSSYKLSDFLTSANTGRGRAPCGGDWDSSVEPPDLPPIEARRGRWSTPFGGRAQAPLTSALGVLSLQVGPRAVWRGSYARRDLPQSLQYQRSRKSYHAEVSGPLSDCKRPVPHFVPHLTEHCYSLRLIAANSVFFASSNTT